MAGSQMLSTVSGINRLSAGTMSHHTLSEPRVMMRA